MALPFDQARRALNFVRRLRLARARYGRSYPSLLLEFHELRHRQGYTPREIFLGDLLNRQPAEEKRRTAISKQGMIALQQRLNPAAAAPLVEDKALFDAKCRELDLPAARAFAFWERGAGRSVAGEALRDDDDWAAFLAGLDAEEIVVKPTLGAYGHGIRFLQRAEGCWRDPRGNRLSAEDLLRDLRDDPAFDRFVLQERVKQHEALTALSGTAYLQTVRVSTVISKAGEPLVVCAEQKLICGDATTSNLAWGSTGNAVAAIDLASGRLKPPVLPREDGVGMDPVERHPVTGNSFAGLVPPLWEETCALAKQAALAFRPLRTVGWDIAATPTGPVLIEGNAWWDPHIQTRSMGPFLRHAWAALDEAGSVAEW